MSNIGHLLGCECLICIDWRLRQGAKTMHNASQPSPETAWPRPPGSVAGVFDAPYGVQPPKPWPRDPSAEAPKEDIYAAAANRILSDENKALKAELAEWRAVALMRRDHIKALAEQVWKLKRDLEFTDTLDVARLKQLREQREEILELRLMISGAKKALYP